MFNVDKKERDYHIIFFSLLNLIFLSFIQWDRYMEKKDKNYYEDKVGIKWGIFNK